MKSNIIIYKSKRKAYYIILAGLLLVAASYILFAYSADEVFGWICLLAALLVLILGATNLRDRKPQIILTEKGITELYSVKEEIEWDQIVGVDDFFYRGQNLVRILLPVSYKPGLIRPTWFWRFSRIYEQQGPKAIYVRVSGLEINSKQLTTIITTIIKTDPAQRNNYLEFVKERI